MRAAWGRNNGRPVLAGCGRAGRLSVRRGWTANGWRENAEIAAINDDQSRERRDQALTQVKVVDDGSP